ncbi:MAG: hypothetical protein GF364_06455 [Candidatus Lokiarchaeota archaeon]|nr:hypothetical protein [Candidatus Lokiarchaeota archaeon]
MRRIIPKFLRYYNRLEVKGIENIPKRGSAIIAPNHSGGFDMDNFAIMSLFDFVKTNNPLRKRVWLCYWDKWAVEEPAWAPLVQQFSPIPVSLTGKGIPYTLVDKIVETGELIAIMPEGHSASIREGYRLWKFYPGVIKLHLRYKIPIIPTACVGFIKAFPILTNIYNPNVVPPWENEIMSQIFRPKKIIISLGKPMFFKDYYDTALTKKQLFRLAAKVRTHVKNELSKFYKNISEQHPYGTKKLF